MVGTKIVIIDYGMGNLGSIANMLGKIGYQAIISSEVGDIAGAGKLILPGVGSFDEGMINLKKLGLIDVLNHKVKIEKVPIMGICLGLQLFTRQSAEGTLAGLGWVQASTVKFDFPPKRSNLKVPHMGWNTVAIRKPSLIFNGLEKEARFYFAHSYHVRCDNQDDILATTDYGYEFASAIQTGNIIGIQFHPEKSHKYGLNILKNYVEAF